MTKNLISVEKYSPINSKEWNLFVDNSKNAHFMHKRDYMDYHSDRFIDCSLLLKSSSNEVIAIFPANISNNIIYSHQGLTFGGLLLCTRANMLTVLKCFHAIANYYIRNHGISNIIYKRVPDFYNRHPSQEDLYALFKMNATIFRRDISSLISLDYKISYTKDKKWSVNKGKNSNLSISESKDSAQFWEILTSVLDEQHRIKPVHTSQEISLLMNKFPDNIRCFIVKTDDSLVVAGALVYETSLVAHTQYLANSPLGRKLRALDYLIDFLISDFYKDKKYFDFGISTENDGTVLNEGLISHKEGFGARAFTHEFYNWDLRNFYDYQQLQID